MNKKIFQTNTICISFQQTHEKSTVSKEGEGGGSGGQDGEYVYT